MDKMNELLGELDKEMILSPDDLSESNLEDMIDGLIENTEIEEFAEDEDEIDAMIEAIIGENELEESGEDEEVDNLLSES